MRYYYALSYYYALEKRDTPIINYNSLFLILFQFLQKEILKNTKKTNQESPKKSTIDTPTPESVPLTEEIQKY